MEFSRIKLDIEGGLALLTLNHPEVMNAVSLEMLEGLSEALRHVEDKSRGVRCLLITGAGKGFCAGANLSQAGKAGEARDVGAALETHYHPLLRRLRHLHCPIVTAVNGAAAGAGMSLALAGDLVLAGKSGYFLQAFRRIGLVPDAGSTYILPRLIGMARAKELALLGENLGAEKALEWGLINRVYEDEALMSEARKLCQDLASGPTVSLGLTRRLLWSSPENSFEQQLDLEFRTQRIAAATSDFREGVAAFREKRRAQFKGE